ncbi:hypothetical protein N0V93_002275 [Gnomoniopsis smithogilvyi]|uniref:Uncharacterized protein n=1 Tax=Gnomoniopsis smithogilvyi TaxID=1191159 RepID=A0A9W8YWC3_9PEZI|nr:hypothetical protein N0V93_002275 [Gnomoniopsis smithogilvyi]
MAHYGARTTVTNVATCYFQAIRKVPVESSETMADVEPFAGRVPKEREFHEGVQASLTFRTSIYAAL